MNSMVLLSAGLDSTAALLHALDAGAVRLALTIDYGQKAARREISQAAKIAQKYGISHQVLKIDFLATESHPFFQTEIQNPELDATELDDPQVTQKSAKAVWVPNRNGVFLNVAAALAEAQNIDQVYVGFNKEEATTFPDNSEAYVESLNKAFSFSTQNSVQVVAPTIAMDKTQIVADLMARDFDLSLLWSCYYGDDEPCGKCESCQRLQRALTNNGRDPSLRSG